MSVSTSASAISSAANRMAEAAVSLVAGRSCQGCTMCCKVLAIEELAKPALTWCKHCAPGTGCKIYDTRPAVCGAFYCEYLKSAALDEHWYPARAKMVIVTDQTTGSLEIHVDPSRKGGWRQEPYYAQLKQWAAAMNPRRQQVLVHDGADTIAVMPNQDKNLGPAPPGKAVLLLEKMTPQGMIYDAIFADESGPAADAVRFRGK